MTRFRRPGTLRIAAFVAGLLAALSGCGRPAAPAVKAPDAGSTCLDDLGREVRVPAQVRRIVSLAPACTEILFAVGAGDRVVGVTTFDNYPPEVAALPSVGGFSRETISVEKLVALEPDLILSSGSLQRDLIEELSRLGLVIVAVEPDSLDDVQENVRLVGRLTGCIPQSERVAAQMAEQLARIRGSLAAIPEGDRPRVFYQVWDRPLRTAGSTSFLGQLIVAAGGRNIFGDLDEAYPLVSEETLISRDPHVIFLPRRPGQEARQLFARPGLDLITAVRTGRIHELDEDIVSRPGPRIGQAVQAMAAELYPELISSDTGDEAAP